MNLPSNLTLEERERIAYITGDVATAKLCADAMDAAAAAANDAEQDGYDRGYADGFDDGFSAGLADET